MLSLSISLDRCENNTDIAELDDGVVINLSNYTAQHRVRIHELPNLVKHHLHDVLPDRFDGNQRRCILALTHFLQPVLSNSGITEEQ